MVLYLAGLKSVDPTLREAAAIDGATERQTFFRVVFPVMPPINVVVVVVTVIESLRAFDIVYIINRGKNGLELLSTLITNNSISEANRVGFGVGDRGRPARDLARPDRHLPRPDDAGGPAMTAAPMAARRGAVVDRTGSRTPVRRVVLYAFLIADGPASGCSRSLWAVYTALRPYADDTSRTATSRCRRR